jgi:6,7-dimethyl-8-ribityllumazine synthase
LWQELLFFLIFLGPARGLSSQNRERGIGAKMPVQDLIGSGMRHSVCFAYKYISEGFGVMRVIEGQLNSQGKRFALIVSRFNSFISEQLLQGANDCLRRHGAAEKDIDVYRVPGSYEIPLVAARAASLKRYDAVLCLGVLIRGETPHFDHIAGFVSKAIGEISLSSGVPVIFGIITADNLEQAIERAGAKAGNKGWDAALAGIEMANLLPQVKE